MTDHTISNPSECRNEKLTEEERAARVAYFDSLGHQWNPATGNWIAKPKVKRPLRFPPESSRQSLWLPDEDYTDSVCLLLPKGYATLIDVDMFHYAIRFDWKVLGRSIIQVEYIPVSYTRRRCGIGRTGYGKFRSKGKAIMHSLHRVLFSESIVGIYEQSVASRDLRKKDIDHINRNFWDNRILNLRLATKSENLHNVAPRAGRSSQYKGVSKVKGKEKWIAQICIKGKTHYLGTFDDEFKAAQAYNAAVRKHCPEFGYVNPLIC